MWKAGGLLKLNVATSKALNYPNFPDKDLRLVGIVVALKRFWGRDISWNKNLNNETLTKLNKFITSKYFQKKYYKSHLGLT